MQSVNNPANPLEFNGKHIEEISFGGTPHDIDALAGKVLTGEKTATSSLLDYYTLGLKTPSKVGDYLSVLNSAGSEAVLIRIEKIEVKPFADITEAFAVEEGDGSLENWRKIHSIYYAERLARIGKKLTAATLLVCEWFTAVPRP